MTIQASDSIPNPSDARSVERTHTSRFRGVMWDKRRGRWIAQISVDDVTRRIGRFEDEVEAARAYDAAARVEHGEFATLNFPTDAEREHAARWLDKREASRMFQISIAAWKKWEKAGFIRGIRSRRRAYYDVEELTRLLPELGPIQPPYPDPERPGCYRVPLTGHPGNRNVREAIIDADSQPLVQGRRFYFKTAKVNRLASVDLSQRGECIPLHRLIMGVTDRALEISHVNGDPLDCRRANLVVKTYAEKVHGNRKMGSLNGRQYTSQFKGVCWDKDRELWLVQIRIGGKGRVVGRFEDEACAALAYDEAARELFGEHAWLNFPDKGERGGAADEQAQRLAA